MTTKMRIVAVDPTVFFVKDGEGLRQQVRVTVENDGAEMPAHLKVRGHGFQESVPLDAVASGTALSSTWTALAAVIDSRL